MLKVQKLSKKFGQKIAVDEVSFDIAPGEIFSLIGPNSSGKTTSSTAIFWSNFFESFCTLSIISV